MSQETALFPSGKGLLWAALRRHGRRVIRRIVDALLPLLEPQSVNRPGARLIQDPADHGTARRIVRRRSSSHVLEHVEGQYFGGFPIADGPRNPREDDAVRLRVERMQRELIANPPGTATS
jgi:hypothetical protein